MKKLPISKSVFKEIRTENCYYVDKTKYIKRLFDDDGKYYFLSRPRRFGKSLFVDTMKEAFSGNRTLFKDLYLEKNWHWEKTYPVIMLSFGGGVIKDREDLEIKLNYLFDQIAANYSIKFNYTTIREKFSELIKKIYHKYSSKVVILVDEYDKPILDNILKTNEASEIRDGLKNIYSVIKDSDAYVKFAFLTGVSKFAKVSLFSGLNNLEDLTLDPVYSGICGYTQKELETVFSDKLDGVNLTNLKHWYNGYNFLGEPVYNPFDVLLYLKSRKFKNYWFETATPGFLAEIIQNKRFYIPSIEKIKATDTLLGSFDIERIEVETLLFQTGYLTIEKTIELGQLVQYQLDYPNYEVKTSLNDHLLYYLTDEPAKKENIKSDLYEALFSNSIESLKTIFHSFYASIPNDWYRKNQLSGYEGYYASIFYCYFAALGLDVTPEDTTNKGRIDMTLKFEDRIYIFEFKVTELIKETHSAMSQIKKKKYFEKYLNDSDKIYLVGVEFSSKDRNITQFEWEKHQQPTTNTQQQKSP